MKIISPGSEIIIVQSSVKGTVSQVNIRGKSPNYSLLYEIVYWESGTRHEVWMYEHEISYQGEQKEMTVTLRMN